MILTVLFSVAVSAATADKVEVPLEFKSCTQNSDCIKVSQTQCSECCAEEAINKNYEQKYQELKQLQCKKYDGPVCDCTGTTDSAVCHLGRCALKRKR